MIRFFDDLNYFVECIREFQEFFHQCGTCMAVWINPQARGKIAELSEEQFNLFQQCFLDLVSWAPDLEEQKEHKIQLSHGYCTPCMRSGMMELAHRRQFRQGYETCFGSAVDGECNQEKCLYRCSCVVTRKQLEVWEKWTTFTPIPIAAYLATVESSIMVH